MSELASSCCVILLYFLQDFLNNDKWGKGIKNNSSPMKYGKHSLHMLPDLGGRRCRICIYSSANRSMSGVIPSLAISS